MPSPVLDTDPNGRAGAHSVQMLPLHPKFPLELSCGQLEDHTAPGQELPAAGGSGDRLRRCSLSWKCRVTKQAPSRIIADWKRSPQLSGISDVLLNCKSHYLHRSVGAQPSEK